MTHVSTEYALVEGDHTDFVNKAQEHLRAGWQCQGGVSVSVRSAFPEDSHRPLVWYVQAMTFEFHVVDGPGDDG